MRPKMAVSSVEKGPVPDERSSAEVRTELLLRPGFDPLADQVFCRLAG